MNRSKLILLQPYFKILAIVTLFLVFKSTWILFTIGCIVSISFSLSHKIGNIFDRLILTVLAFFAFNMGLGAMGWALGFRLTTSILVVVYLFSTLSFVIWKSRQDKDTVLKIKHRYTLADFIPLFVAILTFMLIIVPVIKKRNTNYIYQFVTYGSDNLSHLELTNVTSRNKGYLYDNSHKTSNTMTKNLTAYPQGMHFNISILRDFSTYTFSSIDSFRGQIFFYIFVTAGFLSLLAYILTRFGQLLLDKSRLSSLLIIILYLTLFFGPLTVFYLQGFNTHILALTFLLAQIYIFCLYDTKNQDIKARYLSYFSALLMLIGISFTWSFLLPVSLVACGIIILSAVWKDITKKRIPLAPLLLWLLSFSAFIFIAFIQLYVQLRFGPKSDPLNEPGNIAPTKQQFVILSGLASLLLYFQFKPTQKKYYSQVLAVFTLVSGLFACVIFTYQARSVGHLSYYYYKAAYGVLVLGSIACMALLYTIIRKVGFYNSWYSRLILVFMSVIVVSAFLSNQVFNIKNGEVSGLQPSTANVVGEILNANTNNINNVVFVGSCNRDEDYLVNRLIASVGEDNNKTRQGVSYVHLYKNVTRNDVIDQVELFAKEKNIALTIIDSSGGGYKQLVMKNNLKNTTFFTPLNNSEKRTQITCPNEIK